MVSCYNIRGFAEFCSKENRAAAFATMLATFELAFILGPKGGVFLSETFEQNSRIWLVLFCTSYDFFPF